MRRSLAALACAAVVVGCGSSGADPPSRPVAVAPLRGAPPELVALRRQAGQLLGGGADAYKERLAKLRGHPVVVNKWASWCPPCRSEFPWFARQAELHGRKVAFLGVDASDVEGDARQFLHESPVPYPSYNDPDQKVAAVFHGNVAFPTTAFYDAKGNLTFVHQGAYQSQAKLAEDIDRYTG
jgi:cytochrome c biogenesis protein CcmG, thiol:disulfide interchange protein DsbE